MTAVTLSPDARVGAWDFGDFPYGLEPLTMPPVGRARVLGAAACPDVPRCDVDRVSVELRLLDGGVRAAGRFDLPTAPTYEQLFWFRWITGHQVTFALWRLMGALLAEHPADGAPPGREVLDRLETYTHAYGAMLIYSGSCPRDLYSTLIRPAMVLQHRGFSGTWAPDFAQVRSLLRGRSRGWLGEEGAARLRAAVEAHCAIHDDVAARLVPNGRSLLQNSIAETPVRPSERTSVLYDNFFMTLRAPVADGIVAVQLLRRLRAVALDLAANGLYPLGRDEAVDERQPWGAMVARGERRLGAVVTAAGRYAAEIAWQAR
ncbi:hypothetical protein CA850_02850 [Micromonospora echinospora]|uniref:Uncharacterized protein n=1 Tax=Micromonospora echinospora TaxID=1877 RepID=A0A1C5A4B4_MICEC|nr:hypothetical protein [Micromonospora echinospora]OZV83625.1 hypothetical protein CA850_02850 [Micromonospora echinospora]SCF40038.1 hypothetical protein GA0070618_6279 [Micromonospora echinospora]